MRRCRKQKRNVAAALKLRGYLIIKRIYKNCMDKNLFQNKKLILASGSPRRRELMEKLGIPFEVEVSEADETLPDDIAAEDAALYLSGIKANAVYNLYYEDHMVVIGADTVVIYDGAIYGKPKDEEDAFRMLKTLSGNTHRVITGVTVIAGDGDEEQEITFSNSSEVTFYELSDEEIRDYIATGEPMDKAGAYGIQDHGALLIEHIDGDFYSVMGLPVAQLSRALTDIVS